MKKIELEKEQEEFGGKPVEISYENTNNNND